MDEEDLTAGSDDPDVVGRYTPIKIDQNVIIMGSNHIHVINQAKKTYIKRFQVGLES